MESLIHLKVLYSPYYNSHYNHILCYQMLNTYGCVHHKLAYIATVLKYDAFLPLKTLRNRSVLATANLSVTNNASIFF